MVLGPRVFRFAPLMPGRRQRQQADVLDLLLAFAVREELSARGADPVFRLSRLLAARGNARREFRLMRHRGQHGGLEYAAVFAAPGLIPRLHAGRLGHADLSPSVPRAQVGVRFPVVFRLHAVRVVIARVQILHAVSVHRVFDPSGFVKHIGLSVNEERTVRDQDAQIKPGTRHVHGAVEPPFPAAVRHKAVFQRVVGGAEIHLARAFPQSGAGHGHAASVPQLRHGGHAPGLVKAQPGGHSHPRVGLFRPGPGALRRENIAHSGQFFADRAGKIGAVQDIPDRHAVYGGALQLLFRFGDHHQGGLAPVRPFGHGHFPPDHRAVLLRVNGVDAVSGIGHASVQGEQFPFPGGKGCRRLIRVRVLRGSAGHGHGLLRKRGEARAARQRRAQQQGGRSGQCPFHPHRIPHSAAVSD